MFLRTKLTNKQTNLLCVSSGSTILGDRDLLLPSLRRSRPTKCLNVDKTEKNLKQLQMLTETPAIDLKTAQKVGKEKL